MPSPFPGMDPYLENPAIWPDFHDRLAGQMSADLNRRLPAPYYARLEMRPEVGIIEDGGSARRIVPDVSVVRRPSSGPAASLTAVLDELRTAISPSVEWAVPSEPAHHAFVEIRDPVQGHKLITLIEIVSPSNKHPGTDRRAYLQEQREVLDSDASLVEIDLLRTGDRLLAGPQLEDLLARLDPPPDYLVLVNRAWQRAATLAYQAFPVRLQEPLPCAPVPLRPDQPEVPLDLQFALSQLYDNGPYRRGAVDYRRPPDRRWKGRWPSGRRGCWRACKSRNLICSRFARLPRLSRPNA